jgi:hypothetical protein
MKWMAGLAACALLLGCAPRLRMPAQPREPVSVLGRFNHDLALTPIHGNQEPFSGLQGKKLSIFYLSVKCPHCRTVAPAINEARRHLDSLGYASVNVIIKYNTEQEYIPFAESTGIQGLAYHDRDRRFGLTYGTGVIPLFFVVDEKGDVFRFNQPNDSLSIRVKEKLAACCTDR